MINLVDEAPVHIAGIVVQCFPQQGREVAGRLCLLPGTQVHAISPEGRLVVTVEAGSAEDHLVDTLTRIDNIEGVLASSLIFHHNDAGLPMAQGEEL